MAVIGTLAVLLALALCALAYYMGASRNTKRPSDNHREMARLIQRLIQQDDILPILPTKDREHAEELIDDFFKIPPVKEIR